MTEFQKYTRDYIGENPGFEITYWSQYPPHKEKGPTYAIMSYKQVNEECPCCKSIVVKEAYSGYEKGYVFEVETE